MSELSHVCDPRQTELNTLQTLSSHNWDVFIVPEILIKEFQSLGILEFNDNQHNLVISLSYAPEDKSEFLKVFENHDRNAFFKLTEKRGINHNLYRIVDNKLVFVITLQKAIIDKMPRFTGCYLESKIQGNLYGITTNAYSEKNLDKSVFGIIDTIPEQHIVLTMLNSKEGLFEDVEIDGEAVMLKDPNNFYYPVHFEWRDPSVYNIRGNKADFVFCARDIDGVACIGQGILDLSDLTKPTMVAIEPLKIEVDDNFLYLECPQIFKDNENNSWMLAGVGEKSGIHFQGCWLYKSNKWIKANNNGKFETGYPAGYECYSGKFTVIDDLPYFICWTADPYGLPNSILPPLPVTFDYSNNTCSLESNTPPPIIANLGVLDKPINELKIKSLRSRANNKSELKLPEMTKFETQKYNKKAKETIFN